MLLRLGTVLPASARWGAWEAAVEDCEYDLPQPSCESCLAPLPEHGVMRVPRTHECVHEEGCCTASFDAEGMRVE